MRKEDWISTKQELPCDPEGKKYLIHLDKNNIVEIASYDHISHSFYCSGQIEKNYDVNRVDFWSEIKNPGEEQESMYRFHEGMIIENWKGIVYLIKKVKERSYEATVYGSPLSTHTDIPIALQSKYSIIKSNNVDLILPKFKEGMQIRRISDRKVYTVKNVVDTAKGKYYDVIDTDEKDSQIYFGNQCLYVRHYNFEDGDIVRKLKDSGYVDTATQYRLHKNETQENETIPVRTPLMTTFYETIRKLDFSLIRVDQETSMFSDTQVTYKELEDNYEIVQKHDEPFDIKNFL